MLGLITQTLHPAVVEHEHAVVACDRPLLAASVAWQARVPGGVDHAGAYALADVKLRGGGHGPRRGKSAGNRGAHLIGPQDLASLAVATLGDAGLELRARHHAAFDEQ